MPLSSEDGRGRRNSGGGLSAGGVEGPLALNKQASSLRCLGWEFGALLCMPGRGDDEHCLCHRQQGLPHPLVCL